MDQIHTSGFWVWKSSRASASGLRGRVPPERDPRPVLLVPWRPGEGLPGPSTRFSEETATLLCQFLSGGTRGSLTSDERKWKPKPNVTFGFRFIAEHSLAAGSSFFYPDFHSLSSAPCWHNEAEIQATRRKFARALPQHLRPQCIWEWV